MWATRKGGLWCAIGVVFMATCCTCAVYVPEPNSRKMDEYVDDEPVPNSETYESDIDQELRKKLAQIMMTRKIENALAEAMSNSHASQESRDEGDNSNDGLNKDGPGQDSEKDLKMLEDAEIEQLTSLPETRFVGIGYNLIRAAPEGSFNGRGNFERESGLKVTYHVFNFSSFAENKQVYSNNRKYRIPDQVIYAPPLHSCVRSFTQTVYAGRKSYQSSLAASVEGAGSYGPYEFSASAAMSQAEQESSSQRRLLADRKETCAYGSLRLRKFSESGRMNITADFYEAVKALPRNYDEGQYFRFLDNWGTHIIEKAIVGTRKTTRYQLSYMDSFRALQKSHSAKVGAGINTPALSGSLTFAINSATENTIFSSSEKQRMDEFEIGTPSRPIPIHVTVMPIHEAMDQKYWKPWLQSYESVKRDHMIKAFNSYKFRRGRLAEDPTIRLDLEWPEGTYGFPEPRTGCPPNFIRGCRYQDNEDSNNKNIFEKTYYLKGRFDTNLQMCYCMKSRATKFPWLPGTYCINRFLAGHTCPSGFESGTIKWDDEDKRNDNGKTGDYLPYGQYYYDTKMWFCCRSDGPHDVPIFLPRANPFVLYMHKSRKCQEVKGMSHRVIRVRTDDEDTNNSDSCTPPHPFDMNCNKDHDIYMCYYY